MQPVERHALARGRMRVELAPRTGGALAAVEYGGIPLLRPWNGEPSVRRMAVYPLLPYSNRIAEGRFRFAGTEHVLRRNFGDHPHPLHGLGWQREWAFVPRGTHAASMTLGHRPDGEAAADWPFAFDAEQTVELTDRTVTLTLAFRNADTRPAPVGLGWHPFFPRHDGAVLRFHADAVWRNDARMLPVERGTVPPAWDFSAGRPVENPGLDNCFAGFTGTATLSWPARRLAVTMTADATLGHLVVMTPPPPADFFAVEPVMNANDAINRPDPAAHGLRVLAPGESLRVRMTLTVGETNP
ncbi:Aldose 1-epimerase [Rhodovastum atsumiense]|uniref:Aldose 1-epimerase n=1 Tax=Rhodovastum atsumiense TaxID=504468 RepID=A0A5M6ILD7_9PROT|nr:aldose 1-epimerase [Rhodovastum atsumiense]KAA5609083.1 aldose 1-epimerase [Rhodovastum atsumiense]CAH2602163.1 Aldose 1-epimerase [Rhodovastum atsumiense]